MLLYEELSYKIRGCAIEVRKKYGPGHKENIYQKALAEELDFNKIAYKAEEPIKIFSVRTGKKIGSYQPDFLIDDAVIVEIKALNYLPKKVIDQLYGYLRNSEYELGFLINFGEPRLQIKRIIYTNENKPWFKKLHKG